MVTVDGKTIDLDTRKAIAMLSYLVIEGVADRDFRAALFGHTPHPSGRGEHSAGPSPLCDRPSAPTPTAAVSHVAKSPIPGTDSGTSAECSRANRLAHISAEIEIPELEDDSGDDHPGRIPITRGWRSQDVPVTEVSAEEAAPVLRHYLRKVHRVGPNFDVTVHSSLENSLPMSAVKD